jgi:hypothetical protein
MKCRLRSALSARGTADQVVEKLLRGGRHRDLKVQAEVCLSCRPDYPQKAIRQFERSARARDEGNGGLHPWAHFRSRLEVVVVGRRK